MNINKLINCTHSVNSPQSSSEEKPVNSASSLGKRIIQSQSEEHNPAKRQLTDCKIVKRDIGSLFVPTGPFFNGIAEDQGVIYDGIFEDDRLLLSSENIFERVIHETGTLNVQRFTGKVQYPDGQENEGIFENGFLVEGTKIFKDGVQYNGTFESGLLTKGKCIFPTGEVHKGTFNYGFLSIGTIIKEGKVKASGVFKDGNLFKGFEYLDDGTLERGEFYRGILCDGERFFTDGDIERGYFTEEGHLEHGMRFKADAKCFQEGDFEDGVLVEGEMKFSNGNVFRGVFENELLKEGELWLADGGFMTGFFSRAGELVHGEYIMPLGALIEVRFTQS